MDKEKLTEFLGARYHICCNADASVNAGRVKNTIQPLPSSVGFIIGYKRCTIYCGKCQENVEVEDGRVLHQFQLKTRKLRTGELVTHWHGRCFTCRRNWRNGKWVPRNDYMQCAGTRIVSIVEVIKD